ncbi:hypothetical protein GCM10012319_03260 [Comamonas sp. KCTC 72670]|nr:hypothetical protein GCM10012319_03260 [Comamonas sp. KCTC 72670]
MKASGVTMRAAPTSSKRKAPPGGSACCEAGLDAATINDLQVLGECTPPWRLNLILPPEEARDGAGPAASVPAPRLEDEATVR